MDEMQRAKELAQELFAIHARQAGLDPHTALTNNRAALAMMDAFVVYLIRPTACVDAT